MEKGLVGLAAGRETLYLVGCGTAVLSGSRDATVGIEITIAGDSEEILRGALGPERALPLPVRRSGFVPMPGRLEDGYLKIPISTPPATTSTAPATRRRVILSELPRSSAEKRTPKNDSVPRIGATTLTFPR